MGSTTTCHDIFLTVAGPEGNHVRICVDQQDFLLIEIIHQGNHSNFFTQNQV